MSKKIKRAKHKKVEQTRSIVSNNTDTKFINMWSIEPDLVNADIRNGLKEMLSPESWDFHPNPVDGNCYYLDFSDCREWYDELWRFSDYVSQKCLEKGMRVFPAESFIILATPMDPYEIAGTMTPILSSVETTIIKGNDVTVMN